MPLRFATDVRPFGRRRTKRRALGLLYLVAERMRRQTPGSTGTRRQLKSTKWPGDSLVREVSDRRSGVEFESLTHALKLVELVVEFTLHGKLVDLDGLACFQRRSLFIASLHIYSISRQSGMHTGAPQSVKTGWGHRSEI